MDRVAEQLDTNVNWPPRRGTAISYETKNGPKTGILSEIRWGLVWRDFILEDGRVIAEHKIIGGPKPPAWRDPKEVSQEERRACEEQLVSMSEAGLNPQDREYALWAALTQYLAYTYLKFQKTGTPPSETERL
jgi:hypothetical protein